jgi:hypothetical protein
MFSIHVTHPVDPTPRLRNVYVLHVALSWYGDEGVERQGNMELQSESQSVIERALSYLSVFVDPAFTSQRNDARRKVLIEARQGELQWGSHEEDPRIEALVPRLPDDTDWPEVQQLWVRHFDGEGVEHVVRMTGPDNVARPFLFHPTLTTPRQRRS